MDQRTPEMSEQAPVKQRQRTSAFGIEFSTWDAGRIVDTIVSEPVPAGEGLRLLVTANLDHIVQLNRNPAFRAAYDKAWLTTVDGAPVLLYARLRGLAVPGRITGADLFPEIIERLKPGTHRPLLLCSSETTAAILDNKLKELGFSEHIIVTAPPAFERNEVFGRELVSKLRENRVTHIFFGIGAPKSEIWMDKHRADLPDCYGFGFGAGLDFYAGVKSRAPVFLRKAGLEFLWRVATEPRRLARRYFVTSWAFCWAVYKDLTADRPDTDKTR
ncbi:WecB/TagA/CpsF family glycosyltransferase [Neorhizobium galegae]|uniref:Glycosyltransferase, WecB/TagA/CpsF family n=1 Tax=Neorhizobium galegae bv. officinalis TaxID=323656 RepID=A0A0T7GLU9_NEOGA|nr:WecB/TagA/CpsF family glycosyltransferase [Neorhizobium galegae]CDZ48233.1 Glycosyltransferase, WecB/TagA/CpsF family [Neorhizobium galegae bv. officinalis]